jgi:bifunctional UDP-N-acetylglucosamine pyrophosphorylase/glucosamine-1-phosphate N-acetyltransferase
MPNSPDTEGRVAHRLDVVVLAAGQGKRMNSTLPKVLHPLAGRPLLAHVLDAAAQLEPDQVHVVVGHAAEKVRDTIAGAAVRLPVNWVHQAQQHGTGHAVAQALPDIADDSCVLVLLGDVPLIAPDTLKACLAAAQAGDIGLVTAELDDPAQLGRIVRGDGGEIVGIVEYRDASSAQRGIREINSGIMALPAQALRSLLSEVSADNAQGEYYLTDIIALGRARQMKVVGVVAPTVQEVAGVNDCAQLAELERYRQAQLAEQLMRSGVTVADPARLDIRGEISVGTDCFIDVNVVFQGRVVLGDSVAIGPGCVISDSELGSGVRVEAHTVVDGAIVAANCSLGPFARIRPGTQLGESVKIGNFVETKKARLGRGSKASHLTYLGDAVLGEDCNVGAGTVTCNYDGVNKHQTTVGDGVFVGTNSTLVAPIEIADGAYLGAGSTFTSKVGKGDLAVGRARQRNIQGWVRPDRRKPPED